MLEWEGEEIIGELPDSEIKWAKDVLKRAETSWPDEADVSTAIMIKKRAVKEERWK
ncbi:MAG: hypothetical protein LBI14_05650 [Treponema sp.]|jgi:hypothetical protein|nr:hypothetical protein [Treponema sp.]